MNMVMDVTPVPFVNPFTEQFDLMPFDMMRTYVPYASHLKLEEAARMAAVRDDEAAANFLLSIKENEPELLIISEGFAPDELSVEPPTLR